ncbi:transporter substrate-binding domain-containing protein [Streptococcus oriscaviae]|uniref:Transporter substrate-binding domain-containing protein n=1 Tax=Streptococcus oriscaviae TaxID=2781599 RepID=A0ABX7YN85_9STRE|nr:transporter substrate-binding domain-containing protein [Streptococcus oriscaviae]QUE55163.1 transporter substrate-binding domain-containing protein [Streptococcus oriscaviae]
MKKKVIWIGGLVLVLVLVTVLVRYFSGNNSTSTASQKEEVTTLRVAHTQSYAPYDFINEQGESDGYEVQVLKAIDEKLEQYQFEFIGTSDEDLLVGLESGKYDIGVKGAWYTAERAEKFLIPETAIGASIIGFTVRTADAATYKTIDDFATAGAKLVPISPQNAQYNVIQAYNEEHPDSPIALTAAETFTVADAYAWVLEGRYDGYFDIKLSFEKAVLAEDGAYHQYAEELSWFPYRGIETYPLIHRNQQNEELVAAYETAIKELEEEGVLAKLSETYFGENVFDYVTD